MSTVAKTIVATGATSGIGFELIKQILAHTTPYKFILGARDLAKAQSDYDALKFDKSTHNVTLLPMELNNMNSVNGFAKKTLEQLGKSPIDFLVLNAGTGMFKEKAETGPHGSRWIEPYLVNHLSQHYLLHLLCPKLEESKTRVVVVSSGAVRIVKDTNTLEDAMLSATESEKGVYPATKFIQLLNAHWWRRQLQGKCEVVAVSPGLIPGTGLARKSGQVIPANMPDAKSIPEGAQSVYAALTRDDIPSDPEQIFLTSWGEWWPKDVYGLTLDKSLQDKWSPSKEEIEREEGVTA
ncbi:hypothetical protein F5Y16DRAFT_362275 [Xylariaceae sp. FL0255]|nr:hypothetical protein F5Y16DRAFT_362275 [Xylariaceae sp. FL0255]